MRYEIGPLAHLYGHGGFYDDPELLAPAETPDAAPAVQDLGLVYPGSNYYRSDWVVYSDDSEFCSTLSTLSASLRTTHSTIAATTALEVRNGFVCDAVIYVPGDAGWRVLYPTYRPNDRGAVRLRDASELGARGRGSLNTGKRSLFYLSSAGSFNYGHWLVDDLPRLRYILHLAAGPVTIIVQSFPGMDKIRRQTIEFFCRGLDVEVRFIDPLQLFSFDQLTYVTPVSYHPHLKSPDALDFLRRSALAAIDYSPKPRERIYVKRRRSRGRVLRNGRAIEKFLGDLGFRTVDPEKLSFEEQVRTFANAEVVVGVMGASLCNVVFSPPGTSVIVLSPNDWAEPFYWDLATVLGHEYVAVHGKRAKMYTAAHLDDFWIEPELLKRAMEDNTDLDFPSTGEENPGYFWRKFGLNALMMQIKDLFVTKY